MRLEELVKKFQFISNDEIFFCWSKYLNSLCTELVKFVNWNMKSSRPISVLPWKVLIFKFHTLIMSPVRLVNGILGCTENSIW